MLVMVFLGIAVMVFLSVFLRVQAQKGTAQKEQAQKGIVKKVCDKGNQLKQVCISVCCGSLGSYGPVLPKNVQEFIKVRNQKEDQELGNQ